HLQSYLASPRCQSFFRHRLVSSRLVCPVPRNRFVELGSRLQPSRHAGLRLAPATSLWSLSSTPGGVFLWLVCVWSVELARSRPFEGRARRARFASRIAAPGRVVQSRASPSFGARAADPACSPRRAHRDRQGSRV